MSRVLGYEEEELVGQDVGFLVEPGDAVRNLREVFFDSIKKGEAPPVYETNLRTKSGSNRVVNWSNVILRGSDNSVLGTLSIGADITERVAAEVERDKALSEVRQLKNQLEKENTYLRLELEKLEVSSEIIGRSDAIRYVLHKVSQVAMTDATVLILGETGVGKELVARAVHQHSNRAERPFVSVNCAALPPTLVESELFGHVKGAFTGADRARKGRFELAANGTILLDEVGELPLDIQAKLLRVLQWGEYERVGSSETIKCDARVIAATNRSLQSDIADGRFREDLFYRLNVFPISVPPLRERREDIPELVMHFVRRFAVRYGKKIDQVSMDLMDRLKQLDWPGNIRELENVVERMVIASSGTNLEWPADLALRPERPAATAEVGFLTLAELEKDYIERVLEKTGGQVSGRDGAARILGLNPSTLRARIARLGVTKR
jgi:PAS domain S-box-containing protein